MATTQFIMPTLPDPQKSAMYTTTMPPFHQRSQSYHKPLISAAEYQQMPPLSTSGSASTSPTSPKSYHTRQSRPMYMPAVLRPTEFSSKPTRPVASDSANASDTASVRRLSNSFLGLAGFAVSRLSRRSTGDSGKCLNDEDEEELDCDLFPDVTGQPKRDHWKSDLESQICDDPTCKRTFSYFTRRHHCRKCGNIFCDTHSSFVIPLDQDAMYNPRGVASRSCSHCYKQFREWKSRNNSQASSSTSSEAATNLNNPATPIIGAGPAPIGASPGKAKTDVFGGNNSVAASVPRDWNWSTF